MVSSLGRATYIATVAFVALLLPLFTNSAVDRQTAWKHSRSPAPPAVSLPNPPSPWSAVPPRPLDNLRPLPYPSPPLPSTVYVYDTDPYTADDIFFLLTLQGAVARLNLRTSTPLLYHVSGSNSTSPEFVYWAEYQRLLPKVTFSSAFLNVTAASIITFFQKYITGAYLTALHTDSVNACVSLAGLTDGAVCATPAHLALLKQLNVPVLKDLSNVTEAAFLDQYLTMDAWPFSTRFLSAQIPDKAVTSLSDWTMLIQAVQLHKTASYVRVLEFLHQYHPVPKFNAVFGWVTDDSAEWNFTAGASSNDAGVLASDWLNNGATHSSLSSVYRRPLTNPTKSNPLALHNNTNRHTAAFVFTDGDNICSDMNLLLDKAHWAHPHRGSVPIGWGLNPTLATTMPVGLDMYYQQAVPSNDGFVAFSAQYAFPEHMSKEGVQQWAELSGQAMATADMHVMNFIGNGFNESSFEPLLAQWNIDGIVYFDYYGNYVLPAPLAGSVKWAHNKPCIAVRQSLWADHTTPASIAALLNEQSKDHTSTAGYSVIAVHIWSETVQSLVQVANALDESVLLVKPDELIQLMTQNVLPSNRDEVTV